MDREIKFRAWDKVEKILCQVSLINFEKGCFLTGNSPTPGEYQDDCWVEGIKEGHFVDFENIKLMQYTGLKDRNGKEIYEGDIVKFNDKVGLIKYEIRACQYWILINGDKYYYRPLTADSGYDSGLFNQNLEIIGNIFENPELLK